MTLMKHLLSTDNVLCPTLQTKKKKKKRKLHGHKPTVCYIKNFEKYMTLVTAIKVKKVNGKEG